MNEITPWQAPDCALSVPVARFSSREKFSREINTTYGEGGGLNANYQTVEACFVAANILGQNGLLYGRDFIFKTSGLDCIIFDFCDLEVKKTAEKILGSFQLH